MAEVAVMRGQNELREPAVNTVPPGKPPKKTTIRLGEVLVYRAGSSKLVLRHPLIESPIVVGRDERAQIQLDHETVSRNHAELVCGPFGHWWIHDLHSTNGTYVNGNLVQDRMLNPGDEIRVGRYTLFIRMPDQPERVPALPTPAPQPRFDAEMTMVMPAPQRAPKISAKHIEHTMELRRKLMATEDPSKRLTTLCEFLVGEAIPATAATVVRIAGADTLTHLCEPVQRSGTSSMAELSQSVITSLWDTREPVVATNLPGGTPKLDDAAAKLTLPNHVRSLAVVACPLRNKGDAVDALYVEMPSSYGNDEWRTLLSLVADAFQQAEQVWEMKAHVRASAFVERELQMARQIQDGLMPTTTDFPELRVAFGYKPSRWVGGDYVDAVRLADGRVLLAIADVCGKGLQASLVSSSLHTLVRATTNSNESLVQLTARMNDYLYHYLPEHSFVTMCSIVLNPTTGALECLNAGHLAPLVVRLDGSTRCLQSQENVALGLMETGFTAASDSLAPGEVLLLYTDGLIELLDAQREPLGTQRLHDFMAKLVHDDRSASPEKLKRELFAFLDDYRGAQMSSDDRTFLIAQRHG